MSICHRQCIEGHLIRAAAADVCRRHALLQLRPAGRPWPMAADVLRRLRLCQFTQHFPRRYPMLPARHRWKPLTRTALIEVEVKLWRPAEASGPERSSIALLGTWRPRPIHTLRAACSTLLHNQFGGVAPRGAKCAQSALARNPDRPATQLG